VSDPNFVFVGLIGNAILKKSDKIKFIEGNNIYLKDGSVLNLAFAWDNGREYFEVIKGHEHLFCSDQCVEDFSKKRLHYFPDWILNEGINYSHKLYHYFTHNTKNNDISQFNHKIVKCEICGIEYPSMGRIWVEFAKIENTEIREGFYNEIPISEEERNSYVFLSGLNADTKQYGSFYCYKVSRMEPVFYNFCSYDCAFHYAKQENKIINVTSIMNKDKKGMISPDTEKINNDLENKMLHRPTFL